MKPIDIEFMKRIGEFVNLVPIIAKSDTLTDSEIAAFKERINADILANEIKIYRPTSSVLDDPALIAETVALNSAVPFAIVGSDKIFEINKKPVRGRMYPWGFVDIENEQHCDFTSLRKMLIRTHMEELREYTNDVLYEVYRTSKLATSTPVAFDGKPGYDQVLFRPTSGKFDQERQAHDQKMQKMEAEMKSVFSQKVAEKEAKLKQSEDELYARHREMKDQLERQRQELEEKKRRVAGNKKSKGMFK